MLTNFMVVIISPYIPYIKSLRYAPVTDSVYCYMPITSQLKKNKGLISPNSTKSKQPNQPNSSKQVKDLDTLPKKTYKWKKKT